jgi:hypothetical protein
MTRALLLLLVGCGTASAPHLDGPPPSDAPPRDGVAPGDDAPVDAPAGVYAHTIAIDGVDDFAAGEQLTTTSAGFAARIAWDAQNLYIGYGGPDLDPAAPDTASKWLFVYLDTDPGAGTGSPESLTYNTQKATFPSGFGAELYARYKCDASFTTLEQFAGGTTWMTTATAPVVAHAGTFVELAIPRSALGATAKLGVVTWMINEKPNLEGSFAGLYTGNFADGYAAALPITKYLRADFGAASPPADPANQAP